MKNVLRGLLGKNVHIHTIRSNESIFGELREVDDQFAVVVYGEHTYFISLDKIVWFQEWPGEAEPSFRSDFH
jgi:hypothetical protein